MRAYDPSEFLTKLRIKELSDPKEVAVIGLAKIGEAKPEVVYFKSAGPGSTWLPLPINIVESIIHLTNAKCKDTHHPLVKIKFKQQDEVPEDIGFLLHLLSQQQSSLNRARGPQLKDAGAPPCATVEDGEGSHLLCCWVDYDDHAEVECTVASGP